LIPIIAGAAIVVVLGKTIFGKPKKTNSSIPKSVLEKRFAGLEKRLEKSSKTKLAVLGQPGSGKSTLLMSLTEGRLEPPLDIGCETDATSWARDGEVVIEREFDGRIFVDVPGYDTQEHPVKSYTKFFPFASFDRVLFVVNNKLHKSDQQIFRALKKSGVSLGVVRTFSESLTESDRTVIQDDLHSRLKLRQKDKVFFVSSRLTEGLDSVWDFCICVE